MKKYLDISSIKMPNGLSKINFNYESKSYDLTISLFEKCNLDCNFCFQNHINKKVDLDKIKNIPNLIKTQINKEIKKYNIQFLNILIWGGEIFMDSLPNQIFILYENLTLELLNVIKCENIKIYWTTNGIFSRREKILSLLNNTNSKISFSYDVIDRFKKDDLKVLWKENLLYFKEKNLLNIISLVLTKENINAIVNTSDIILTDLFLNDAYNLDINYYIPCETNKKECIPSSEEIYSFYKYCIDNKIYKIKIIQEILKTVSSIYNDYDIEKYCDCKYFTHIQIDEVSKNCVKRLGKDYNLNFFYNKLTNEVSDDNCNEVKNSLAIIKMNCMYCKYFNRCQGFCWLSILSKYNNLKFCPLKKIYQYIIEEK